MFHKKSAIIKKAIRQGTVSCLFIYPLDRPYDESARQAFFAELNNPQLDPDGCCFIRWDFDTNRVVSVFGNIPPNCDEVMEESEESEDSE